MMSRLLVSLALLGYALPARADSFRTPAMREGPPVSIQAYGSQNPACLEWTNGCVICVRGSSHASCSTPGIACTPAGLTCKQLAHPAATK